MSEDENTPATDDALAADASGEREPAAEEATDAAATEAATTEPVAGEPVAGGVSEATAAESVEEEDEDDGPIEAEDPFSGSEDAKPVDLGDDADMLETAVKNVLNAGLRTPDIMQDGKAKVSTSGMGEAITMELDKLLG